MNCNNCNSATILRNGEIKSGFQRFICKDCSRSWQELYVYQSYNVKNEHIILLTKEGCGIRSTARILQISPKTILRRIFKNRKELKKNNSHFTWTNV